MGVLTLTPRVHCNTVTPMLHHPTADSYWQSPSGHKAARVVGNADSGYWFARHFLRAVWGMPEPTRGLVLGQWADSVEAADRWAEGKNGGLT